MLRLRCRRSVRRTSAVLRSQAGRALTIAVLFVIALWVVYRLLWATDAQVSGARVVDREAFLRSYGREKVIELRAGGQIPMCRAPKYEVANATGQQSPHAAIRPCEPREERLLHLAAQRLLLNQSHPLAANVTKCRLKAILWKNDQESETTQEEHFEKHELAVKLNNDFILAECEVQGRRTPVHQVLVQAPPKQHVHKRYFDQRAVVGHHRRPDVLILSLGALDVIRWREELPKTAAYLNILQSLSLPGLNGLGYDTKDNLIPLLTGKHLHELPNAVRGTKGARYVDEFTFMWYEFEKHGYATMLAEDTALDTLFNKNLHGFEQRPTDHYMRPFWIEMAAGNCILGRPRHEYSFTYLRDFFFNYRNVTKFATFVHHPGIEGNPPHVGAIDEPLARFLASLHMAGEAENLVILLLGNPKRPEPAETFSQTDIMTHRLAVGELVLPSWFKLVHQEMWENLIRNTGQMTTPFDLNVMLRDILLVESKVMDLVPIQDRHASSLLRAMVRDKNCLSGAVPLPWCTCVRWDHPRGHSKEVRKAAAELAHEYNRMTESARTRCEEMTGHEVQYADMFVPKSKDTIRVRGGPVHLWQEKKITTYYFHLVLRSKAGTLTGVVSHDNLTKTFNAFPESIVALERHRDPCVTDQKLVDVCLCKK